MESASGSDVSDVQSVTYSDDELAMPSKNGTSKRVVSYYADSDSSDDCTSVSRVALDPMQMILSVLGPHQRALIKGLQREKAELQSKVAELKSNVDSEKRKLKEQVTETNTMANKVQRLECEAAMKPLLVTATPTPTSALEPTPCSFNSPVVYEPQVHDEADEDPNQLGVYATYTPIVVGGSVHPTSLCSSTNMIDLLSNDIKDGLQSYLHPTTANNKAISAAQLEAIALARRRNVVDKLAFANGDATGVGKTRIALGFVLNHHAHVEAAKKPRVLYVSVSNLFEDVEKDAAAIGFTTKFVNGTKFQNKTKGDIVIASSTSLFISHNVLHNFSAARLLRWLLSNNQAATPGHEPILIVDEVHKVANATKRGAAAAALLDGAHAAGVHILVLSATFASNVPQLKLTAKITGMVKSEVHPENPVGDFKELARTLRRLGEVGLETLAMQLRGSGGYVSRSLSMQGVEFELVEAEMDTAANELYTLAAALWKDLFDIPTLWTGAPIMLGVFHSASLRFFKALTMLIRLPSVIATAISALERGESVILTCLSTDEASISRSDAADNDDDDATDAQVMETAEVESRLKNGALLDTILQVTAFARKHAQATPTIEETIARIEARAIAMNLPVVGALDVAIHHIAEALGNDRSKIVELTGRQKAVNCAFGDDTREKTNWKIVARDESLLSGKQRFQNGNARVAMLSAAASTGVSLHDLNGARRVMIAMELPYSSVQFVQTAGRAHRAGQKSAPKIVLVTLPDVKAESRFAASICSRLAQLGAISHGDRRSGAGCVDFGDAIGTTGVVSNKAATTVAAKHNIQLGNTPTSIKLMNKCLAMAPQDGNLVMECFKTTLAEMQANNSVQNTRIKTIEVDGTVITEIGSFERPLPPGVSGRSMVCAYQLDKGLTFANAVAKCATSTVWMCTKRVSDAAPYSPLVIADLKPHNTGVGYTARLTRPNGNQTVLDQAMFERIYMSIDTSCPSARTVWEQWYAKCTVDGTRFKKFSVLTLPVIDFISSSYISNVRLMRVINGDSPVRLGILLPPSAIHKLDASSAGPSSSATGLI